MIIALDIPIYRCDVAFFMEPNIEEFKEFYKKNKTNMDEEDFRDILKDLKDKDVAGAVWTCGVNYICYIKNMKKKGHIDHELYHLTNTILTDRGVEHTRNDEPFAYFNEYLHDEFRSIIKKHWLKKTPSNDETGTTGSGSPEQCEKNEETQRRIHSSKKLGARSTEITKMWRCDHIL